MVHFETEVYHREGNTIIGAEVIVYSDEGERIGNIKITNESDYNALVERIDNLGDEFVTFEAGSSIEGETIETILANLAETTPINATKLGGLQSDQFSKPGHTHNKTEITNLYNYDISLNKYNVEPGQQVKVTVKVLKQNNTGVPNEVINILKNGAVWKSTVRTNASGVYETTFTPDSEGLITFSVNNQKVQLLCQETTWKTVYSASYITLQKKGNRVRLFIDTDYTVGVTAVWKTIHTFSEQLQQYMPTNVDVTHVGTYHIIYRITTTGEVRVATYGNSVTVALNGRLEWSI